MAKNKDLDSLVVFTKFMNGKNDMVNKLEEALDLSEMEDAEYQQFVISEMQTKTVSSLQGGLRDVFPRANFYFFDPAANDVFVN
jgi:hypothetical protein